MTDNTPAAQAAMQEAVRLTDEELCRIQGEYLDYDGHIGERIASAIRAGRAIQSALLSKLRPPVADEWIRDETLWSWAEQIMGGKEAHHVGRDRVLRFARAALASAPVAGEAQPVALYQARIRPTWRTDENAWSKWEDCTAEQAADYERVPLLHDWQYEVRRLYAAPQASEAVPTLPRGWQLALNLAIDAIENAAPAGQDWPVNWPAILHGLVELRAALSAQPGAQKEQSDG